MFGRALSKTAALCYFQIYHAIKHDHHRGALARGKWGGMDGLLSPIHKSSSIMDSHMGDQIRQSTSSHKVLDNGKPERRCEMVSLQDFS
jgi:hypothetical protein